ncbi:MAG: hypothetical protein OXB92_10045 [Acidimicrobiaceae bacterium]|nr:helix-turn-helix domain-containing protein [Acidimicrobiia bacterium]MCY4494184.1 hypothetical protein [Acidimicrobiaceae bacterium]
MTLRWTVGAEHVDREAQLSVDEIAERLGRHQSAVYRELARGGGLDGYCARATHRRAGDAAARPKMSKRAGDSVLAGEVAEGLKQRWSPHAISADLKARGMQVCAETVMLQMCRIYDAECPEQEFGVGERLRS